MHAGQEVRGVQAVLGDGVAVAVRDPSDQAAAFESTQVIGGLAGGTALGQAAQLVVSGRRSLLVKPLVWQPNVSSV